MGVIRQGYEVLIDLDNMVEQRLDEADDLAGVPGLGDTIERLREEANFFARVGDVIDLLICEINSLSILNDHPEATQ